MLSEKITIIIPEHKRPEHLRRLLAYFLSFGLKIIVADSSVDEFKHLHEFKDRIVYRFLPGQDLATKLNKIVGLIETPYVVMCANDDFLVPKALEEIVGFLEQNPAYNSGQGLYTDFKVKNGNIVNSLRYKDKIDIDLSSDLAADRLMSLQRRYFQYYYAVYRSSAFIKVISSLIYNQQSQIKNLCLLESYMSCFGAIDGKHIIKPIFYSARENMAVSAATETVTIPVIIKQKQYQEEYAQYLKLLAVHLSNVDGLTKDQASLCVENSVKAYILQLYPDYFTLKGKIRFSLKSFLKQMGFVKFLQQFFSKKDDVATLTDDIGKSEEMQKIEFYIKKYDYIYKDN